MIRSWVRTAGIVLLVAALCCVICLALFYFAQPVIDGGISTAAALCSLFVTAVILIVVGDIGPRVLGAFTLLYCGSYAVALTLPPTPDVNVPSMLLGVLMPLIVVTVVSVSAVKARWLWRVSAEPEATR